MKKILIIVLALVLCFALAACGGNDAPAAEAPADTGTAPADTPPAPEPAAGGNTYTIGNDFYGTITFTIPDDPSLTVTVLDNDIEESLDVLNEYYENLVLSNNIEYVRAHILGDGFNMAIGFFDYGDSPMRTFTAEAWFRSNSSSEISLGGLTGFTYLSDINMYNFPAASQHGGRIIGVYPLERPESRNDFTEDDWNALFEIPVVKEILSSVVFSTETLDEPPWETTPLSMGGYDVTPTDGWEIFSTWVNDVDLKKDGANDLRSITGDAAQIAISSWSMNTAQEWVDEKIIGSAVDLEEVQIPNITINGREFLAVEYGKQLSSTFAFVTSQGPSFDPASQKIVIITISYMTDYSGAMKQLEKIEIK